MNLKPMFFFRILKELNIIYYFPWLKFLFCMMLVNCQLLGVSTLYVINQAIWLFIIIIFLLLSRIFLIDLIGCLDFTNKFLITLKGKLGFQFCKMCLKFKIASPNSTPILNTSFHCLQMLNFLWWLILNLFESLTRVSYFFLLLWNCYHFLDNVFYIRNNLT
jgi:hypothetical protein